MLGKVLLVLMCLSCFVLPNASADEAPATAKTLVVAHRGLLKHAPENTLSNVRACLELRIGFEIDVRRSKDGHLICVHDDTVNRTTNGTGAVSELTLEQLQRLDAGSWFGKLFRNERIPTFAEVMALVKANAQRPLVVAVDLKVPDIEADCVRIAEASGVLSQVLFIGTSISDPNVRRKLREASPQAQVACLNETSKDSASVLADKDSDWVYLRFLPTNEAVQRIHRAGKRVFIAGPNVVRIELDNWRAALAAGTDAILTDFPLELAIEIREAGQDPDVKFQRLAERYLDEFPILSPIGATTLGDHRFDSDIDYFSEITRNNHRAFYQRVLRDLAKIDKKLLSRENQVDYQLLTQQVRGDLWQLDELQEWAWNPVMYTQLTGGAIYGLMAREFAPIEERLMHVAHRLNLLPSLYEQIRVTLDPQRVPPIHAETAVKQNRGLISILDNMVKPHRGKLDESDRMYLDNAIAGAIEATETHQQWLEKERVEKKTSESNSN